VVRSGRFSVRRCAAVGIRGSERSPAAGNDAPPGSDHRWFRPGRRLTSRAEKDSTLAGPVVGYCKAGIPSARPTHFEAAMIHEDAVVTRRGILLIAATLRLSAGDSDFWNRKEPSEWSPDEVDR